MFLLWENLSHGTWIKNSYSHLCRKRKTAGHIDGLTVTKVVDFHLEHKIKLKHSFDERIIQAISDIQSCLFYEVVLLSDPSPIIALPCQTVSFWM